jgi:hypothetical protein
MNYRQHSILSGKHFLQISKDLVNENQHIKKLHREIKSSLEFCEEEGKHFQPIIEIWIAQKNGSTRVGYKLKEHNLYLENWLNDSEIEDIQSVMKIQNVAAIKFIYRKEKLSTAHKFIKDLQKGN